MCTIRVKKQWLGGIKLPYVLLALFFVFGLFLSACAPGTGLFAGGNWQLSGLQHQHIHTFEIDFNNPQMLYAGDMQNGVFFTSDGGQHWVARSAGLPLPCIVYQLSFEPTGKKLYAATNKGLFVSPDKAQHWSASNSLPSDGITALAFDTNAPHTIYAATAAHGVFKSTNDGAAWSSISSGLPANVSVNSLAFDSVQRQLWAATAGGVYRSGDGGATWQALNDGLPSKGEVNVVRVASASGGTKGLLYAGTNRGFYLSQDSGAHWMPSQESLTGFTIYAILLDFRNPGTVYIGTSFGAYRSDNGGQTWRGIGPGLPRGQPIYALIFGASDYSQLFAAANDVYLYPGSSGGINLTNLLPVALVLLFFYLLYRVAARGRNRRREAAKPTLTAGSNVSPVSPPDEEKAQGPG